MSGECNDAAPASMKAITTTIYDDYVSGFRDFHRLVNDRGVRPRGSHSESRAHDVRLFDDRADGGIHKAMMPEVPRRCGLHSFEQVYEPIVGLWRVILDDKYGHASFN
jgi:hypothetical protein